VVAPVFADEELEGLRRFPEIGREELFRFFTLTPADVAFVDPGRGRGPADRLGLAVALCSLPWLGFVPDEVSSAPRAAVMRTAYRFLADGEPIQLSTSYEPLHLTAGTPVEWPEDGAAVGVVARFDAIGIRIDEFVERINVRSALADEIERLGLPVRAAFVQVIERTYYAAGTPVEAADIVLPGDRYELVYRVPVD
jgi:hypothetical protein